MSVTLSSLIALPLDFILRTWQNCLDFEGRGRSSLDSKMFTPPVGTTVYYKGVLCGGQPFHCIVLRARMAPAIINKCPVCKRHGRQAVQTPNGWLPMKESNNQYLRGYHVFTSLCSTVMTHVQRYDHIYAFCFLKTASCKPS